MRIAFFADSYKPYLSGVTNSIEILAKELRRLGHRVYILAPNYPGHIDSDPNIIRFPSFAGGYPKFRLAIPYVREIPEVDIIHAHSPFQAGLLARYVARKRLVPFVYSFHTLFTRYVHYARFVPQELAKLGIVAYLRAFCRGADAIVAPSELAKRVLRKWGIGRPVEVIPSGLELRHFPDSPAEVRARLRKKFGILETDKVLLYAGRLSKEKNIPFLLNAFEKLLQLTPYNLQLALIGGGPLLKNLQLTTCLPAGTADNLQLILPGEIPYPEILSYYSLGDIFVFASLTETQGLVLAEAKAAGLPIVALWAGGLVETVRSGLDGYLVPRSLDKFVEHVRRLLADDKLREEMSRAALADARARFASDVVAKRIETLYNSLTKPEEA